MTSKRRVRSAFGAIGAALAALAVLAVGGTSASATDIEAITNYQVTAEVGADSSMVITEEITWDPGPNERRGIIRDLVTEDILEGGMRRVYGVELLSVTRDGAEVNYTQETSDGRLSLRIGDEDIIITGPHTFRIQYRVTNALDVLTVEDLAAGAPAEVKPGDVELYWDFISKEWTFPILQGSVAITGPAPALAAACYAETTIGELCRVGLNAGPAGATTMVADLDYPGGLTGVIAWRPDAFTTIAPPNIQESAQAQAAQRAGIAATVVGPLSLLAVLGAIVTAIISRRRNAGTAITVTPVRYTPPDGLRPAQIEAGLTDTVTSRGVVATLVDLAARGHIVMKEETERVFHKEGMELTWTGTGKDSMKGWEERLLAAIFKGQPTALIGGYDPILVEAVQDMRRRLSDEARVSGRYNPQGERPDRPYKITMVVGMAMLFGTIFLAAGLSETPGASLLAVIMVGMPALACIIGGGIGAAITPRRQSSKSAAFITEAEGFKRLLATDSAEARRDFATRMNLTPAALFATYFPYAIVYDLEDTWIKNFPDLRPEDLYPFGLIATSPSVLYSRINTMTSSVSSATTTRSSGSGFGGGGGSGGGGGGGGGSSF